MPRVPISPGPEVSSRPLPTPYENPNRSPDEFGAAAGEAIAQGGLAISRGIEQVVDRTRAARVMNEVGQFGVEADATLHDPKSGFLTLQGEKALGAYEGATQGLRKLQSDRAAAITDPYARELFMQHSANVLRGALRQLETHTAGQRVHLEALSLDSTQKAMIDSGVKAIDQVSADQYTQTGATATRAYWSDRANGAVADEKMREFVATANGYRLDRLLASPNTAEEARRFFMSRHDALPAARLDEYTKRVEAAGIDAQADTKARDFTAAGMGRDGQVDRRRMQGLIDQVPGGPLKDKIQQKADHRAAIFDAAWRDEATNAAANAINTATTPDGRLDFSVPGATDALEKLRVKWPQKAAEIEKRGLIDQRRAGIEESKARYMEGIEAFVDEPETFARMKPADFESTYRPLLNTTHYALFKERYDKLQRRMDVSPAEAAQIENAFVREARKAMGLGKAKRISDLSDAKKADATDALRSVQDRVKEWSITNNKPFPPPEELRSMISEAIAPTLIQVTPPAGTGFISYRGRQEKVPTFRVEAQKRLERDLALPLPSPAGRVNMRAPDGSAVTLPAEQLDEALKQGYRRE